MKTMQLRPIGVGEVMWRIVGKTISWSLKLDKQKAAGPLQVSTCLKGAYTVGMAKYILRRDNRYNHSSCC